MPRLNVELDPCEYSYDVQSQVHRRLIHQLLESLPAYDQKDLLREILVTVVKLAEQDAGRGELKILRTAVKEMRHAFRIFQKYQGISKASIFGSARTRPDHPNYQMAVELSRQLVLNGWMVITGAGPGIMEAANRGAGRDGSFGLNILLPFEQVANEFIQNDPKLVNFKYFFTRKLFFVKETDAIVVFPGGMGTQDECFESLTLVQTGKDNPSPVVLVEEPGGTYWEKWLRFVEGELVTDGLISPSDRSLFRRAHSVEEAVGCLIQFYSCYHSMRYVRRRTKLVLRLKKALSDGHLEFLNRQFSDIVLEGTIEQSQAFPEEEDQPELLDLPRLVLAFDQKSFGRLRELIDAVNSGIHSSYS